MGFLAYFKIFDRSGLLDLTYLTFAAGGTFSKYSHEFQTITEAGEDIIHICDDCDIAINQEIIAEQKVCPNCGRKKLRQEKAVEVGNIFELGTRFSKAFAMRFTDKSGDERDIFMGCYGIGLSRLMGAIVETCHDEQGIIWPEEVAPFKVHLLEVRSKKLEVRSAADKIYNDLQVKGIEILYDDREIGAGEKFADADLIGCPYRLVISEKTLAKESVEVKRRDSKKCELVKIKDIIKFLASRL